uniref:plasma serine protease inhibitor-like n=1 Tax=Euleptes europaea TaxID=460621 RepID=UPI002541CCFA|nr:plasma serine protease inhibitor-like [Euleptes europaea]
MMFILCLSILLSGLQVHCHHVPEQHKEQEHSGGKNRLEHQYQPPAEGQGTEATGYDKIVEENAEFAFRLYKLMASDTPPQNVFFSPLSISTAFAMLAMGAKAETHRQIFNGLGFNLSDTEENEIHRGFNLLIRTLNQPNNVTQTNIGNALFVEESSQLLPEFLNNVKTLYEAEAISTCFKNSAAAENEINEYVKDKTNGKITQAIQGLDPSTVMVLLNYIFFKASWEIPFNHVLTRETDFFVDAKTTVKVNMMYQKGSYNFLRDEDLSSWVVKVPYKGDSSAWFIMPDQGKLKAVEDGLSGEDFTKWNISAKYEKIELYIPKFSISGSYDVRGLLQRLGVNDVFTDYADLSGVTGQRNLKVSKAVHKAVLDVHEGGTEAAAVTVLEFQRTSAEFPLATIIKFNRPFIMAIANEQICHFIFIAKVMDPTAQ